LKPNGTKNACNEYFGIDYIFNRQHEGIEINRIPAKYDFLANDGLASKKLL
jgi:hypothetical protein